MKKVLVVIVLLLVNIELYATVTANIGNGAFASVHKDKLYAVNGNTGKAQILATVPATIGGVATNPSGGFNSLAINTTDGILYFVSNGSNSKAVFGYNMRTNTFILLEADMIANRGVTSLGKNLGSGGGFYANGRYFFGVEKVGAGNSAVYSIATGSNGTAFVGNAVLEVNSFAYQWGDFAIDGANGIMYTGSSGIGYQALDLGVMGVVGDETVINANSSASFGQIGIDLGGQFYYVFGNTAGFATIDLVTGATGAGKSITLDGTTSPADGSYDAAGIIPYDSSIGDIVWNDIDGNGVQGAGEPGIAGVTIELYDDINGNGLIDNGGSYNNTDTLLATDTTDANGAYRFNGLIPGSYIIKVTDANGHLTLGSFTTAGGDTQTALITQSQQFVDTVDFGYNVPKGSVTGSVLDNASNPVVGAQVKIVDTVTGATINDINGNPLLVTVNPADGSYQFNDVPVGDYNIVEINPSGYLSISDNDSSNDGDTTPNANTNDDTIPLTVTNAEIDADNNFVDEAVGTISGTVKDTAGVGLGGVTIVVKDAGGNVVNDANGNPLTATTAPDGSYSFTNVPVGDYDITETDLANYISASDGDSSSDGDTHPNSNTNDNQIPVTITLGKNDTDNNFVDHLPVAPTAVDDLATGTTGNPVTLTTLSNDTDPESDINASSVHLTDSTATDTDGDGDNDTLVVAGEGTWTVDNTTGDITFTPIAGFTADPTPITYNVKDNTGLTSNNATETVDYPQTAPTAVDDLATGTTGNPVTLTTLSNDTDPESDINASSVHLTDPTATDTDGDGDNDTLVVAGEGTWTVDNTTGDITFTPIAGFTADPTPITYNVKDNTGLTSNNATEAIEYISGIIAGTVYEDTNGNGIQDPGEPGISGVSLLVTDANGATQNLTTDNHGNYATLVPPGNTVVDIDDTTLPTGFTQTEGTDSTTVAVPLGGIGSDVDGYKPSANAGRVEGVVFADTNGNGVQDPNETGIEGVTVYVTDNAGHIQIVTTDSTGAYGVTVPAGSATIDIDESTLAGGSTQTAGTDTTTVTVVAGEVVTDSDGYQPPANAGTVEGLVYEDSNANGTQDAGELGIEGVTVKVTDATGNVITLVTDENGSYSTLVSAGATLINIDETSLPGGSTQTEGTDMTTVNVPTGGTATDKDGYAPSPSNGKVEGIVYEDSNANGTQDAGESGIAGVAVTVTDSKGNIHLLTTDALGAYSVNVPAGDALVDIEQSDIDATFTRTEGTDPTTVTVPAAGVANDVDGFFNGGNWTGSMMEDTSHDGYGDTPVANVTIDLYTDPNGDGNPNDGILVDTVTTDSNGNYLFSGLISGDYVAVVTQPNNLIHASENEGGDDNDKPDNGIINAIAGHVSPGETDRGNDFAGKSVGSLSGNVSNEDSTGLHPISGVTLILLDENSNEVARTTTDVNGNYTFINLEPGAYRIRQVQPNDYEHLRENEGGADNDGVILTTENEISAVVGVGENDVQNDFINIAKVNILAQHPTPTPTPTPRPNPVAFSNASQIGDILNDSPIADAIDSREGDYFSFVAPQSGLYIFTSDVNTFTGAAIYDRNEERLNLNEFSDVGNFTIRQTLKNGERYYIRIYANQDTNYVLTVDFVSINDFVTRFYEDMLGRSPEAAGLQYWVDLLSDGVLSGVDVAHGFGNSPEFTARNLNDNDYLTALYQTFFDRTPDTQGLVFWLDKLQNGMSRSEVLDGFANSKEFKEKTASYGIKHTSTLTEKFVNRLYAIGLTRYPDGAGFRYWVNGLTQGQFNARIAVSGFVFSDEFINRNLDNTSYVQTLYRMLFDRAADTTGLNTWVTKLNNGETREAVLDGFLNSQEFIKIMKMYGIRRK